MIYRHKIRVTLDVDSSEKEGPSTSEIASALFQYRKREDLNEVAEILDTQEMVTKLMFELNPPVRFSGHKIAMSLTIDTPINLNYPVPVVIHYYNEGTEKEYRDRIRRKIYTKTSYPDKKLRVLTFKYGLSEFTFKVSENDVLQP